MNSLEIKDKKNSLKERCHEIVSVCAAEIREMTEDEKAEFEAAKAEIISLNEQLKALQEKLKEYENELPDEDDENTHEITNNERNITNTMTKTFSILSAVRDVANNRSLDATAQAVINEGANEMRKAGLSFGGQIQLPLEKRTITVSSEGTDTVGVDVVNFLEPLRAKNVLAQAGAKYMTGLVGDVVVPVMGGANVAWEGETGNHSGDTTFTSAKLQPKRLTAYVDVSKQFLAQTSVDAENLIKNDIINAINNKLEATILSNTSGATQPTGIFNGVTSAETTTVSGFSGITTLEAAVEDANVMGECKYIMSNKAKAKLRGMSKSAKSTELVCEQNMIDGTEVLSTSHVADSADTVANIVYGDFSNLAIGQWGAIDLTVDPFTKASDGCVRLVVNAYFDAKVLRQDAFAFGKA